MVYINDVAAVLNVILEQFEKIRFSVGIGYILCVSGFLFLIGNLPYHVLHKSGLGFLVMYRFLFFLVFCCSLFIFGFLVFGYVVNILKIRHYQLDILKDCDVCFYLLYMDYFRNKRFYRFTNSVAVSKLEKAGFIEDYLSYSYSITEKGRNVLKNHRRYDGIFYNAKQYASNYVKCVDSKMSSNVFMNYQFHDSIENDDVSDTNSYLIYRFSKKLLELSSK